MNNLSKSYEDWREFCKFVQTATVARKETAAEKERAIKRAKKDYQFFVDRYFPHYTINEETNEIIPCAGFQIDFANKVLDDPNFFGVAEWPREHGKSVHIDIFIPIWLWINEELTGMVLLGKNYNDACGLLSDIQAEFQFNDQLKADFGAQYNQGNWEDGNFIIKDDIEFIALGRSQSPRGIRNKSKRPNYGVGDDLDDDEIVQNLDRVEKVVNWLLGSFYGALSIKKSRFIIAGNGIHPKSILRHVVGDIDQDTPKRKGLYHSKIFATTDGTFTGKPTWSRYTSEELQRKFERMGYYLAQREFFHNAIIKGKIFKQEWIQWGKPLRYSKYDALVAYFDPSYKPKTTNDFKSIMMWGKTGNYLHCLKAFVKQTSITQAVKWMYDLHLSLPEDVICDYYMEDVFLQDMFFEDFDKEGHDRGFILPIRGDKRAKPDKFMRIQSLAPFYERGYVIHNENERKNPDMNTHIDLTLGFQKGANIHDDSLDASEGAIFKLQKRGIMAGDKRGSYGNRKHKNMY